MARPMVLIKRNLLKEMYDKYEQGVPVLKLIAQYRLEDSITAPTLTKLLGYYENMHKLKADKSKKAIALTIDHSLFPEWLENSIFNVTTAPSLYSYSGKMPLGSWSLKVNK